MHKTFKHSIDTDSLRKAVEEILRSSKAHRPTTVEDPIAVEIGLAQVKVKTSAKVTHEMLFGTKNNDRKAPKHHFAPSKAVRELEKRRLSKKGMVHGAQFN